MAGACDSVNRLLSPYLDDELSGADRKVVDGHLQGCPACQARLVDLRATNAAMQAYLTHRSEGVDFAGFSAKVIAQIKNEPLSLGQRLRVFWTELMAYHSAAIYSAFGAGAAAALAVGVVLARPAAVSNNLVVHSLKVSDPRYEPVVMHTNDGETVIMLVEHNQSEDSDAAPAAGDAAQAPAPGSVGDKVEKPEDGDVPHGGTL